jgi:predicted ABC-class ATPase
MSKEKTVPFKSPQDLEITIKMVNSGIISGMAISKGVTIIVGGGYHGKSTLLEAIEKGVYNHIPGDGREFVITDPSAFKIRAEDGRAINNVNISPFINNLPHKQNTERFSTENASGSTSQATNIIEAIELGSRVLLLDEDTSATNFMIRDERMQKLVSKEKEPITPFIDQVRNLFENKDVSSILVVGGTGDYFEAADRVIMMDEYIPKNLTKEAKKIISNYKSNRLNETKINFNNNFKRKPLAESFNPFRGKKIKVDIKGLHTVIFGNETINLNYLEQLTDLNQTKAIAHIIHYLGKKYYNGEISLEEGIDMLINDIEKEGFEIISPFKNQHPGFFAMPRKYEIGAAVNRMRSLNVIN